ncbi:MAG: lipoprotein [Bacteroidales bacterium]
MKKIFFAILAIAALASCSKGNLQEDNSNEIKLIGAVNEVSTKDVIGTNNEFTASVAAWESNSTVDYTADTKWQTTSKILGGATSANLILATPQYYNANNTIKSYVKAWYPIGTPTKGVVAITNTTGNVDVMYAAEIFGSKLEQIVTPLTFNHLTTQLKFEVIEGTGLATGTTLTSIKLKNVQIPTSLNIATGALDAAAATDYTIQGISTSAIGTTATIVGNPIMIIPRTSTGLVLDIVTSTTTFTNIPIIIETDANLLAGKAYTIKLTFKQSAIELKTSVVAWTNGTGTGEVE